jgi:hypothetical protein
MSWGLVLLVVGILQLGNLIFMVLMVRAFKTHIERGH